MLERVIILAAAVCGFAVLVVPSGGDDADETAAPTGLFGGSASASPFSGSSNKTLASNAGTGSFGGEHSLSRERDGHFYAAARIEGANMRMLVDTGASVIALTGGDARAAGVNWSDSDVRHIGSGASGAVYGVPVTLREVEIGGMVRRNVDAVVIPKGLAISLLGQSYLSKIGAVEIADDKMVLRSK